MRTRHHIRFTQSRPLVPAALLLLLAWGAGCAARPDAVAPRVRVVPIGVGWAQSSVNAVIIRQHSLVTHRGMQYAAYYDPDGQVVLAKRRLDSDAWTTHRTSYAGNVRDAHNAISIAVDGRGVLHMAWDHHGQPLRYVRGTAPGALTLTEPMPMTGALESQVTYPQFFDLPGGDLLFVYRDGSSGRGDVMINRYDVASGTWQAVQHPLLDGEGTRNAYINQLAVDRAGGWHLSWVWRETPDVASNHDLAYAYSPDEGQTWQTSTGEPYSLPITAATAEVVRRIPQGSTLINQTTMTVDARGRPLIATYWRPEGTDVPQYQLVWHDGNAWRASQVGERTTPFRLSGGGTKRIPMSRPLVAAGQDDAVYVVFRDEERGDHVSVAVSTDADRAVWRVVDLPSGPVGLWEPTYDPVAWRERGMLHLFLQRVGQGDGETLEALPPQPVAVLEWTP